MGLTFYIFLL